MSKAPLIRIYSLKIIRLKDVTRDSPNEKYIKRLNQQRYTQKMQRENSSGQSINLRDLRIQRLGKWQDCEDA